jgi:hypothetical protein
MVGPPVLHDWELKAKAKYFPPYPVFGAAEMVRHLVSPHQKRGANDECVCWRWKMRVVESWRIQRGRKGGRSTPEMLLVGVRLVERLAREDDELHL